MRTAKRVAARKGPAKEVESEEEEIGLALVELGRGLELSFSRSAACALIRTSVSLPALPSTHAPTRQTRHPALARKTFTGQLPPFSLC